MVPAQNCFREAGGQRHSASGRLAWYSYDFGNTAVELVIALYLAQWVVVDLGYSATSFGLVFGFSTLAAALSAPYLGDRVDRHGQQWEWLVGLSLLAAAFVASLTWLGSARPILLFGVLVLGNYFFNLSAIVYNSTLKRVAQGTNVLSVSASGVGLSYLGGLLALAGIEALVSGKLGGSFRGRSSAYAPAAFFFLLFAGPTVLLVKHLARRASPEDQRPRESWLARPWRRVLRRPDVGRLLLAYFVYNAAMYGFALYFPLFLRQGLGLDGSRLSAVWAAAVLCIAAGAYLGGRVATSVWITDRALVLSLGLWSVAVAVLAVSAPSPLAYGVIALQALAAGSVIALTRGLLAGETGDSVQGAAFGLMGLAQRLSAGAGAMIWPWLSAQTVQQSSGVRVAMAGMAVLAAATVPILWGHRLTGRLAPGHENRAS